MRLGRIHTVGEQQVDLRVLSPPDSTNLMPATVKTRFHKVQPLRVAMLVAVLCATLGGHSQTAQAGPSERSRELRTFIPILQAMYASFNRGDFDAAVAPLDPQIEWTEPASFPGGGTYHGRVAVKGYLRQSRDGWGEGRSEPEWFIIAGDHVVVFVYARFRPKGGSQWQEARLADVYTVRNRKIVQMNAFADRRAALDWANVETDKRN
jgi:ketosteroid isomerase-like protein